jgi:AcrR family transcriptional regulator
MPSEVEAAKGAGPADRSGFRKPTREDAIALARTRFLEGQRIEMGSLATELGIGRTTLYRWVGERDELIGEVVAGLVDDWFTAVAGDVRGTGRERVLDLFRKFLDVAAASEPVTELAEREPALTMRLLLDRRGAVALRSKQLLAEVTERDLPDREVPENIVDAIEMGAASLVWANIATGRDPDIDGAVSLTSTLIDVCPPKTR